MPHDGNSTWDDLMKEADNGELILLYGAYCRFKHRKDGQATIHEILVLREFRGRGLGRLMIQKIAVRTGVTSILAKCPDYLESNTFWKHLGFTLEGQSYTKTGQLMNHWRVIV